MGLGSGGGLGLGGSTTRVYGTGGSAVGRPRTAEAMASSSRNDHASVGSNGGGDGFEDEH
uniref:Uncharacterized protein n=1 Tax=Oryza rufipogon TaxID=4529 RepID=A0A0E0PIQ8_ORYRU